MLLHSGGIWRDRERGPTSRQAATIAPATNATWLLGPGGKLLSGSLLTLKKLPSAAN